jgi:LDH2 family malate/lactate/ureidoglycolate dehydrogenase
MTDYVFNKTVRIPFKEIKEWSAQIYKKAGMSEKDAYVVADIQAAADVRGVYSHGIQRCESYVKKLKRNVICPTAKPKVVKDAGAFALVDADNAMGQIGAHFAMEVAIEKAKKFGTSVVSVKRSNHIGTMAYYAMMAAQEDMIGVCYSQGGANTMAPTGGSEKLLGNNPIGYAFPTYNKPPIVLDMALSVVAAGKLDIARITGNPIPDTWALDEEGNPITDPSKFFSLQPIAGYKGYALSFITTLLTAVLSGCPWGREQGDLIADTDDPMDIAQMMQVINIGAITDVEEFKKNVDAAVDLIKGSKKKKEVKEILVPGEPEAKNEMRQMKSGIEYPVELLEKLRGFSDEMGVIAPF